MEKKWWHRILYVFIDSETDSVSSPPGLVEIIMEIIYSSFSDEVLIYDSVCLNDP